MSDLHRVTILGVDKTASSCLLEIECVNHDEQVVPLEAPFYANLLVDLYLLTVLEISAPVATLETPPPSGWEHAGPGLPWFWRYAQHYCGGESTELEAARERLGVELLDEGLDADEAWCEALDVELESALSNITASRVEGWRNHYNADCAKIEVRLPNIAWLDFLVAGVVMKVVYGPYTTWDCL